MNNKYVIITVTMKTLQRVFLFFFFFSKFLLFIFSSSSHLIIIFVNPLIKRDRKENLMLPLTISYQEPKLEVCNWQNESVLKSPNPKRFGLKSEKKNIGADILDFVSGRARSWKVHLLQTSNLNTNLKDKYMLQCLVSLSRKLLSFIIYF